MRSKSFAGMTCSIAGALESVGDRWSLLVLRDLILGLSRFDDLQSSTGIPPQTLAARLRQLERSGIVARRPYQDRPVRYDYKLTAKGHDLVLVMTAIREWGDRWKLHGAVGAPLEVLDRATGHQVTLAMIDSETAELVDLGRLVTRPGPGADEPMLARLSRASSTTTHTHRIQ
jgi:DNA-binding HxlR family transcriptional regulator